MTDMEVQATEELSDPVTIGVDAYISQDYARAEREKLWRKVWRRVRGYRSTWGGLRG